MIRALILFAAASLPGAALAQTQQSGGGRLEIAGDAPSACIVRGAAATGMVNATIGSGDSVGSRIQIVEMADANTAEPRETSVELALPVVCNSPHRLVLRSGNGGLLRAGARGRDAQGGFAEFLPYQMSAVWAGQQAAGASNADGALTIDSAGGRAGQMSVSLKVAKGGTPLVAGTYSDEIIIELQVAD
jgi:hypothetical protein